MEGIDLSVPFRKTAAKTAKLVQLPTASSHSIFKNWKAIAIVGVVAFAIYYFWLGTKPTEQFQSKGMTTKKKVEVVPHFQNGESAFKRYQSSAMGKERHWNEAVDHYQQALADPQPGDPIGQICFRLAALFHQGVPESYDDKADMRMPGIPPDAEQAIHYYREAIKQGYHGAVLPLASIYHWGLTGFEGNREVAKHLYGVVLKTGTTYEKGQAKDRLRQMKEEDGHAISNGMLEDDMGVTASFGNTSFGNDPYVEHFMDIDKSPYALGKDESTRDLDEKYVDDLIDNKLRMNDSRRVDSTTESSVGVLSDPQNARDHVVVNSARQSLERLRANTHIQYDVPTTFKMIHEYIVKDSDLSSTKRETAAQVLRELSKGIANLGYEQAKEIDALHLVWNRIHSQVYSQNPEKRHTLKENLVNELAECVEYGELVCPTGRLNRIIDTLNNQDPVVKIQPKWAVKKLMVSRAGAIEKSLLSKARPEVRDAMQSMKPTARQRQLQNEFMQKVRKAIERDLTRSYVDTGLMSKELLKTELDAWSMV